MKRTILFLILALMLCAALVVGVNAMDSTEYTWDSANNIFDFRGYSSTFVDENGTAHITAGYIVNADAEQMFKDMFGEGSNFKYGVFGAFVKRADGTLLSPLTVDKTTGSVVANYENNIPVKFCDFNTSFLDKTGTNVDRGQINAILKNIIHDEEDYRTKEVCLGIYVTNGEFVKYITSGGISDTPEVIRFADFAQGFEAIKNVNKNSGKPIALTELFETIKDDVTFNNLVVTATLDDKPKDISLTNNMLTLVDTGVWEITIYDKDLYCAPVSATVTVNPCDKLAVMFPNTDKYLYRVGNQNTIVLGSLFKAIGDFTISDLEIKLTGSDNVTSKYTKNDDWTQGTIKFEGTGVVTVTASCKGGNPISLNLEVVDAVNATSATSAKSNNIVLLDDVGFSSIDVTGGYTLFGNGFTMTCTTDSVAKNMAYAFVTMENGTLDNVQIKVPNFSYSILYSSNQSESATDGDGRYYNIRSAVIMKGKSSIRNSYISGGRAAIYLPDGNATIENSTIVGGAAANIHVVSPKSLTLKDVTLIQKPTQATVNDTSKTIMGLSIFMMCDQNGIAAPLNIEGTFTQYAWANEEYKKYVPSAGQSLVETALKQSDFIHKITYEDGVTRDSINLGIVYMPDGMGSVNEPTIDDNRKNINDVPYGIASISGAKVYSYKNTNGTDEVFKTTPTFTPNSYSGTLPSVSYDGQYGQLSSTYTEQNGWCYSFSIDLDTVGSYDFKFDDLIVQKYGEKLSYTVKLVNGNSVGTSIALSDSAVINLILTVTDNLFYDINGDKISDKIVSHTIHLEINATKTSIEPPKQTAEIGGTPLLVVKSKNSDWTCALPALEGVKVTYWSTTEKAYKEIALSSLTPNKTGQQNGTEKTWTYQCEDFTLTITSGIVHEKNSVYAMPVVVNNGGNKLYFVMSNSNGYVGTGTSSRTVTLDYQFKDNNGGELEFSKTWQFNYADYKNGKQYSYSEFVKGTLKEAGSCVTPDTLVTLADGTQVRIDSLTGNEKLLVWNHNTGKLEAAPVAYIVNHDNVAEKVEVIGLCFSDGKVLNVINEHVLYNLTLNKYVAIGSDNAEDFIGHEFASLDGDRLNKISLTDVKRTVKVTEIYEVVSYKHLTCFTNGVLSTSAYLDKLLNIFDIDEQTLTYSSEKIAADIEQYGLYAYEDFEGLISEEAFELYDAQYLKIAVGKGYITWDDILDLIDIYFNVGVSPIQ